MDTRINSKALQRFAEVASTVANSEITKWKDEGGKILGYFCSSMPEELATAAGLLPVRLRATGSTGTELSDAHLSNLNCSFPRNSFNMALKGEYEFIDGLIVFNSCDHIRRVYDHWKRQLDTPFVKILSLPKKAEPAQVDWFQSELVKLKEGLEEEFGVTISDDDICSAIRLHNETRRLLAELYELRKADNPVITGSETLAVVVASTTMPKKLYNELLKELLEDLKQAEGIKDHRARLMIIGPEMDNPEYIKEIEDQGCLVVADSLCYGSRLFWGKVNEDAADPLQALAQYYIADRPSDAGVFTEYESRSQFVRNMIDEFNVEGAILSRLIFCESWGFEQYSFIQDFKEWDVPLLSIDREYTLTAVGQLRTRVQAFLEKMEN